MTLTADRAAHWYVVQTKPKQEARAEDNLSAWGVETFLPRIRGRVRGLSPSTLATRVVPMFPSYLFVRFELEGMGQKVRYTRGVTKILGIESRPTAVDDGLVQVIRDRVGDDGCVKLVPPQLRPGDRVRITAGPLCDLIGIFDSTSSASARVSLLLLAINGQMRVTVDAALVEKLAESQHPALR
jgi:transcriptional antiterminator RfaH